MSRLLWRFLREENGQDLIEYALLAGFISYASTAFISAIGTRVNEWYVGYGTTISSINKAATTCNRPYRFLLYSSMVGWSLIDRHMEWNRSASATGQRVLTCHGSTRCCT